MINVDLNQIPTMTVNEAAILSGCDAEEFAKPGVYRILSGSRGIIEEFEFLGNVTEIQIPTIDEVVAQFVSYGDDEDEVRDMVEEFYGLQIEEDHVNFGFTEEEYEMWVKIG